jgi:chemotaxis protein CheY-P-specific phosphatase CheC
MNNEINTIEDIMIRSFQKAASSYSMITKEKFIIKKPHIHICPLSEISFISHNNKAEDKDIVLITNIKGEISGKSFLIYDQQSATKISHKTNLGFNDPIDTFEVLKEIDNILSASFISVLSDITSLSMYGDVPLLEEMKSDKTLEFIKNIMNKNNYCDNILYVASVIESEQMDIANHFIWVFKEDITKLMNL